MPIKATDLYNKHNRERERQMQLTQQFSSIGFNNFARKKHSSGLATDRNSKIYQSKH